MGEVADRIPEQGSERETTDRGATAAAPAGLPGRIRGLQRAAGNAAFGRFVRRQLQRSIDPPGTGWDGLNGSEHVPRAGLTAEQKAVASEFRTYLESTRNMRGEWARRAGKIAAEYPVAAQRATLYAELQRQMMQVHKSWGAVVRAGADGSRIFYGSLGRAFVVDAEGRCFVGAINDAAHFTKDAAGKLVPSYGSLTRIDVPKVPVGGGGGGAPPAATPKPAPEAPPKPGAPKPGAAGARTMRPGLNLGSLTRIARGIGIQLVIMIVIGRLLAKAEQERYEEMWKTSVEPEVPRLLAAQAEAAAKLAEDDPFRPVFADVTVELSYWGSKWRGGTATENIEKMAVVSVKPTLTRREPKEEKVDELDYPSITSSVPFRRVSHLTFSIELDFDVSTEERLQRAAYLAAERGTSAADAVRGHGWTEQQQAQFAFAYVDVTADWPDKAALHEEAIRVHARLLRDVSLIARFSRASVLAARSAAEQGLSARKAADQTHWSSDKARLNYVEAYVEVTRDRPELKALHDEAVAYRDELRAAAGSALSPADQQMLLDWLREGTGAR